MLFSRSVVSDSLWPHGLQHARLPFASPSPEACSNSYPLSWWCHPTISSSIVPFPYCPQSFPTPRSFPMSWLFPSAGQTIGASASASVLSMNIQDWFPLGLTGLISLLSKGLSRVLSNTIIQKHQFFGSQPSLWSNSHIHTWLLERTSVIDISFFFPIFFSITVYSRISNIVPVPYSRTLLFIHFTCKSLHLLTPNSEG